jgi:hypothetical protein
MTEPDENLFRRISPSWVNWDDDEATERSASILLSIQRSGKA